MAKLTDEELERIGRVIRQHGHAPGMEGPLYDEVRRLRTPQPCGHPVGCIVQGKEGTAYCGWCEEVTRLRGRT